MSEHWTQICCLSGKCTSQIFSQRWEFMEIRSAAFLIPSPPSSIRCCLGDSRFSNWDVRFPDTFGLKGWWCGSSDLSCHLPGPNENILWELRQQLVFITCSRRAGVRTCCASFLCHLSAPGQPCRQLPTCSPGSLWTAKYLLSSLFPFFFYLPFFQSNAQKSRKPGSSWCSFESVEQAHRCAQPWCSGVWEHRLLLFQQQSHPCAQQWGGRAGCAVLCHCATPVTWGVTDLSENDTGHTLSFLGEHLASWSPGLRGKNKNWAVLRIVQFHFSWSPKTFQKLDSGAQMNTQLQEIYKTWEDASCDISQGTRDLSCACGNLTTALDPLKHLMLIYIF